METGPARRYGATKVELRCLYHRAPRKRAMNTVLWIGENNGKRA